MKPERICVICGAEAPEGATRHSWGPITLYHHTGCGVYYHDLLAPRLRDALQRTLKRWTQQGPIIQERHHEP